MKTFWIMLEWFCLALPLFLFSFLIFFWLDRQIFWLLRYGGWILFACYLIASLYGLYRYLPKIDAWLLRTSRGLILFMLCLLNIIITLASICYQVFRIDLLSIVVISSISIFSYCSIVLLVESIAEYKTSKETWKQFRESSN